MANNPSAKKRIKTAERNRQRNLGQRTKIKSSIKKTMVAIEEKSEDVPEILRETTKTIDTIARKGIIHKNKAARLKSRLTKKANVLAK